MVPPLCLGGNVFGWTADEKTSFAVLDRALAAGCTFIDTADAYSAWVPGNKGGESETIIGRWMASRRNRAQLIIGTKVGAQLAPDKKGLSPAYIKRAVEDSLRRLQTDYIDLYQSHRDDSTVPVADVLATYGELITAGKVRVIGASNFTAARLREALTAAPPRYESLQPEYNLYARAGYEAELEPLCRANEVGVIGYYALASGFLTGKYRSAADSGLSPRGKTVIDKYLNDRGKRILAALDDIAAQTKSSPTRVALAWIMARPGITSAIASASRPEQLDDLIGAAALRLDDAAIDELDTASAY
jgi:aryl-alcohol dehydrogenase-like predicted oxidoreductase